MQRQVETKESASRVTNISLAHNNVNVLQNSAGTPFNPFEVTLGALDPLAGPGNRIGDKITVKGILFKFFVEAALGRSKVYFRFMLVKMAKGDTLNRATLFKDQCGNKMIDQINTERFTIVAQKTVNVTAPNLVASTVGATGVPATGTIAGMTGNRIFSMYVPGKRFGRNGNLIYESGSYTQVKFYDYRLVVVAYDWYGTPQDVNNVGFINDGYFKMYFKDA